MGCLDRHNKRLYAARLVDVKEGRLATPVEILFTSVTDEPLVHLRLKALETDALEYLQSDKSKWQNPEIFPVTVNIFDARGCRAGVGS